MSKNREIATNKIIQLHNRTDLTTETSRATSAEGSLDTKGSTETSRAQSAEGSLATTISNIISNKQKTMKFISKYCNQLKRIELK